MQIRPVVNPLTAQALKVHNETSGRGNYPQEWVNNYFPSSTNANDSAAVTVQQDHSTPTSSIATTHACCDKKYLCYLGAAAVVFSAICCIEVLL